jgi:hypothetical protein
MKGVVGGLEGSSDSRRWLKRLLMKNAAEAADAEHKKSRREGAVGRFI